MTHIPQLHGSLKRVFITEINMDGYEGFFVDSHVPILIKHSCALNICIGCIVRVKISLHEDLHQIESTDLEFFWSYDDNNERMFFAYAYYDPNEPDYIFQEDMGALEINMPPYMATAGHKPIAFKVRQNDDPCSKFVIETEPLFECDGIVVSNEKVQGKMTSFIFTNGCQSYSDFQFTPRDCNPPRLGSFVKFLVQHNYYVHRHSGSHRIAYILDEELPPPRGVQVGDLYRYRKVSHQQAEMTVVTLVLNDYEVGDKDANGEFEHEILGYIYDAHNHIRPFTLYDEIVILKCADKRNVSPWVVDQAKEASMEKQLKDGERMRNKANFAQMCPLSNPRPSYATLQNFPSFHSEDVDTAATVFHLSRDDKTIMETSSNEQQSSQHECENKDKSQLQRGCHKTLIKSFGEETLQRKREKTDTTIREQLNQNSSENSSAASSQSNHTRSATILPANGIATGDCTNEIIRRPLSMRPSFFHKPPVNAPSFDAPYAHSPNIGINTSLSSNNGYHPLNNPPSFAFLPSSSAQDPNSLATLSTSTISNSNNDDWENLPITFEKLLHRR